MGVVNYSKIRSTVYSISLLVLVLSVFDESFRIRHINFKPKNEVEVERAARAAPQRKWTKLGLRLRWVQVLRQDFLPVVSSGYTHRKFYNGLNFLRFYLHTLSLRLK